MPTGRNHAFESEGPTHGLDDDRNHDFSEFDEEGEEDFEDEDGEINDEGDADMLLEQSQ